MRQTLRSSRYFLALSVLALAGAALPASALTPPAVKLDAGGGITIQVDSSGTVTYGAGCGTAPPNATCNVGTVVLPPALTAGEIGLEGTVIGPFTLSADIVGEGRTYYLAHSSVTGMDIGVNSLTTGATGGTLTVSFTDTGYSVSGLIELATQTSYATGNTGSTTYTGYLDTTNTPFGMGSLIGSIPNVRSNADASFNVTGGTSVSLTAVSAITLGPNGSYSDDFSLHATPTTGVTVTCSATGTGFVGVPFDSGVPTVTGGTTPYTFSIIGTLPAGLTLDTSTGEITGTPTAPGSFDLKVTDSAGLVGTPTCPFTIVGPSTTLTTLSVSPSTTVVSGTPVTITVTETNTGGDTLNSVSVTGTNSCATFTGPTTLAARASANFTCTFAPTATVAWTAAGNGTDTYGNVVPATGETTSGTITVTPTAAPCLLSSLGPAGVFSVLGLSGAQVNIQGPIPGGGSVGIGASAKLQIQAALNNNIYADSSAQIQYGGGGSDSGTTTTESFTAIQNAAVTAAATFAALTPTQTFSSQIQSATTIMGNGGQNVISLTNQVNLNGANLTIAGGPNDAFIFNIAQGQNFSLQNGASIILSGVSPSQVLFNFLGNGANVTSNGGNTAGIFLDLKGQIQIQGGTNSSVFISGNQINFQQAKNVNPTVSPIKCPGPTPLSLSCPVSTGTVGTPYSSALVAMGGVSPYTYSIALGSISPLSLDSTTGAIMGTPTSAGTLNFTGEVVDSSGNAATNTVTQACSIAVTTTPPYTCQISPTQTIISGTSWNSFNTSGSNDIVWVHAHIGTPSGLSTTTKTTLDFNNVTFTVNGKAYGMPDGVLIFDPAAPATPTTVFTTTGGSTGNGFWTTTFNPNDLSDEMFFVGNAILVDSNISGGGTANFSYTVNSTDPTFAYSWQWSAAVFTYWPFTSATQPDTGNNGAEIQPLHGPGGYHAGTPLNTTVQQSLIQGPRGGGGSNFTGSWSATGNGTCVGNPYP